ncbi:MAG: hypothetical protein KBB09_02625, partial [Firmicutes bacterium]|nr:hypothetical protein [Bacillota bacterium]
LTGVTIADSLVTSPGYATESISADGVLNVGEAWTWTYSYSVSQDLIDAGVSIANTATADCAQLDAIQDGCSVPITQNPKVDLEKLVNDIDADAPQGPYVLIESEVTYKFVVRNTGNTTLTDVIINDDVIGPITTIPSLSVGTEQTFVRTASAAAGQHTNIGTVTTSQGASDTDSANYFGVTDKIWVYDFTTATDIVADGWVVDDGSASSVNNVRSSRNPLNLDEGAAALISPDGGFQLISGQGLYLDYIGVSSPYAFTGDFTMEVLFSLAVDSTNTFSMQLYPGDTQISWPDNYVYTDFYGMGKVGNESWYVDENHLNNYITIVSQTGTIPGLNRTGDNTWKIIKQGNYYEVWMNGSQICGFTATICAGSKYYMTLYAEHGLNGLLYFKRVTVSFDGQMVTSK